MLELLLTVALMQIPSVPPDNKTEVAIERMEKLLPGLDITNGIKILTLQSKRKPLCQDAD